MSKRQVPAETREFLRQWLYRTVETSGLSPSALALKAGVSPSTATNFLNDLVRSAPSRSTLLKLADAAGVEPPPPSPRPPATEAPRAAPLLTVDDRTVPYGLKRHATCLAFARKRHVVNQLALPCDEEHRLENHVAELYRDWIDLERASGTIIDAATITAVFERYYPPQPEYEKHYLDRPGAKNSSAPTPEASEPPSSEEPDQTISKTAVSEVKAMPPDPSGPPLAA